MGKVCFVDDNFRLSKCFVNRNYVELADKIEQEKESLTFYQEAGELIAGYHITKNEPLSILFQRTFYVVRFVFKDVDTMHDAEQEKCMTELFMVLKSHIETEKGYYNLRLPSHIVDAVKAYNAIFKEGYFCGGTVEELIHGKKVEYQLKGGIKVFFGI